jgi:aerobic carbon-monoxide dehydrogenase medium subunit
MTGTKYLKPASVEEACAIIAEHGPLAKPLAGGTDLLVQWNTRSNKPELLVSLKNLGMDQIQQDPNGDLVIGSLSTINCMLDNEIIREKYPALCEAAVDFGSEQVRNRATIGGNLCNGSPAADMALPLMALGARITVAGVQGTRELDLNGFFVGPGKTALLPGDLLTEIRLPACPDASAAVFLKHKRSAMDVAVVCVSAYLELQDVQTCSKINVVLGAVGPTPLSAGKATDILCRAPVTEDLIEQAADLAVEEALPIDDVRASAWYRRKLVKVLTFRAILAAYDQARHSFEDS